MRNATLLVFGALAAVVACQPERPREQVTMEPTPTAVVERTATADIQPASGSDVTGRAVFTTVNGQVQLEVRLNATPGTHAVHIHEYGDCSAADASSAGGHWNPTGEEHGKWGEPPFHLGDIGNVEVGDDGTGTLTMTTDLWSIGTGASDDVVGKSIVVHAGADDYTTQPAGDSGERVGCGVIELGSPSGGMGTGTTPTPAGEMGEGG